MEVCVSTCDLVRLAAAAATSVSRICASAAANLTKAQVLTQTSIAALAQANAEPQSVLKLLQG